MAHTDISTKICRLEFNHPLLCALVLEQIFNDLELKDLKICRLVCQHWNSISLRQMKHHQNVRISLREEDRLNQFLNNETGFSEYRRFKFTYSMESEQNLVKFMNMSKIPLKDVIFVIGWNDDVNFNLIDKFLSFLAQNSKNWESFGIEIHLESSRVPPTQDLESFRINWTQLTSLGIWHITDHPIFLPILEKASELERLVIIEGPMYSEYRPYLENLIHTLIELELFECFLNPAQERYNLPKFTKLKRLKITRKSDRSFDLKIPTLPELTELYLEFDSTLPARLRFENKGIFPKLESLVWNYAMYIDLKEFPDMFPNLKRFHSKNIHTPLVWKDLRGIEELNCTSLDDKRIIGFHLDLSPQENAESNDHDPYKKCADWSDIYKRDKYSTHEENTQSGIRVLSELKRLTITAEHISNASIIFGLLKCKSLRSVRFQNPSLYLTKEILVWMADELNLMNLSIDVSHRDWYSSPEANYFRQKHPNSQLVLPYHPTRSSRFTQ